MITNTHFNPDLLASALSKSVPLPDDDLKALQKELTDDPAGRGYSRMADSAVVVAINVAYMIVNPTPKQPIPRTTATNDEFAKLVAKAGAKAGKPGAPNEKAKYYLDTVIPLILRSATIDLTSSAITDTLDALVALGTLTQGEVTAFMTRPDVDYQAEVERPSRASVLFGDGVTLELSDIVAARG